MRQRQYPLHPNAPSPRVGDPGCRTGTSGMKWSTRCAARSVMRRPPQLPPQRTQSASGTPVRAEAPAFARERDQALGLAPNALEPCEPACEPGPPPRGLCVVGWEEAARQERLERLLDKARHALAVAQVRRFGEKRLQVLAYHTMQHVRRGVARGVVDRRQGHRLDCGRSRAAGRRAATRRVALTSQTRRGGFGVRRLRSTSQFSQAPNSVTTVQDRLAQGPRIQRVGPPADTDEELANVTRVIVEGPRASPTLLMHPVMGGRRIAGVVRMSGQSAEVRVAGKARLSREDPGRVSPRRSSYGQPARAQPRSTRKRRYASLSSSI